MKYFYAFIFSLFICATANAQSQNVMANTSGVVIRPTNFWSVDASNGRTGLGLGLSALTNTNTSNFRTAISLANYVTNPIIPLTNGGTGSDTDFGARSNIGLGWYVLTNTDATNFRSNIGLADYVTNPIVPITNGGLGTTNIAVARTNLGLGFSALTNTNSTNFRLSIQLSDYVTNPIIPLTNGGTGATNAATARTNLGLGLLALTNTNNSNFRTNIELGLSALTNTNTSNFRTAIGLADYVVNSVVPLANGGTGAGNATNARINLNLSWSALTNTSSGDFLVSLFGANTNPVLVSTNGSVISPNNFWQAAPISTIVQYFTSITTNTTSYASNSRNLFAHSLSTNVFGITNTIILPQNANTFAGDIATIIHRGSTSSTTVVKSGDIYANDLMVLSNRNETVEFMYEQDVWTIAENPSFTEPIFFSGTNASNNSAQSRTNLGLGLTSLTNTNTTNFQSAILFTNGPPTNTGNVTFSSAAAWMEVNVLTNGSNVTFRVPLFKSP